MGGEDWQYWIEALADANLLSTNVTTVAYDYIGPELTHPVYRQGTIGKAKEHLEKTGRQLNAFLQKKCNGHAYVSINKAVVTQASAAIPVVPLYISLLFRVMKDKHIHEGCIEQMWRLFSERLYNNVNLRTIVDEDGLIRLDDLEMRADVQQEVETLWNKVDSDNLHDISDIKGYLSDFYKLFGFGIDGLDYDQPVRTETALTFLQSDENLSVM